MSPRERADAWVERSKALCDLGRWKEAELQARRAIEADPSHGRTRLQLAHILAHTGKVLDAQQLARGVLAEEPTSAWAARLLSACHGSLGRHVEALKMAQLAVRLSDGDALSLQLLSQSQQDAGDLLAARETAQQLISRHPHWADGFVRLAQTQHSHIGAAECYREALRLDPHSEEALAGLAEASASLGQYRQAVSLAWESLRADFGDVARQRRFARSAWVYLLLNRIAMPWRGSEAVLSDSCGEACARGFLSTGNTLFARLRFAFRAELLWLLAWTVVSIGAVASAFLPAYASDVMVPLLATPALLGLVVPFFIGFGVTATVRQLMDLGITRRMGRGTAASLLARFAVSGVALVLAACVALLVWPEWSGPGWMLFFGTLLAVQDVPRWRAQWQDGRRVGQSLRVRDALGIAVQRQTQRWLTPRGLVVLALAAMLAGVWAYRCQPLLESGWAWPAAALAAAMLMAGFHAATGQAMSKAGFSSRVQQWRDFSGTLHDLAWWLVVPAVWVMLDAPVAGSDSTGLIHKLATVLVLLLGAWLAVRAWRAAIALFSSELRAVAQRPGIPPQG